MNYLKHYLKAIEQPLPEMIRTFRYEQIYLAYHIGKATKDTENNKILEVGCGCRPLSSLAEILNSVTFTGIDNDSEIIKRASEMPDFFYRNRHNLMFQEADARKTPFQDNQFALTFSTYNLLGSMQSEEDKRSIIAEQRRVTTKNGTIINIGWAQNVGTTNFLERYYQNIGAKIRDINLYRTVLDIGDVERISQSKMVALYNKEGIKDIETTELGLLWIAVSGRKL